MSSLVWLIVSCIRLDADSPDVTICKVIAIDIDRERARIFNLTILFQLKNRFILGLYHSDDRFVVLFISKMTQQIQ